MTDKRKSDGVNRRTVLHRGALASGAIAFAGGAFVKEAAANEGTIAFFDTVEDIIGERVRILAYNQRSSYACRDANQQNRTVRYVIDHVGGVNEAHFINDRPRKGMTFEVVETSECQTGGTQASLRQVTD